MTPLYDVAFHRVNNGRYLHIRPVSKLAVVRAVRQRSHAGNWFERSGADGKGDFMTPDHAAIRQALPHQYRKAFDRATSGMSFGHTADTLHASLTLYTTRGRCLGTIHCEGYERE